MPIEYSINTQTKVAVTRVKGEVGFQDFVDFVAEMRLHPEFSPELSELVDLSQCGNLRINFSETSIIAQYVDPFSPKSRRAIVVSTPANMGAARMYQMLHDDVTRCEIFKQFDDAWLWLSSDATVPQDRPESSSLHKAHPES